jgi:amidophosphoribosyltransferase
MPTASGLIGLVSPNVPVDVSDMIASMRAIQQRGHHSWGLANLDEGIIHSQSQSGTLPDQKLKLRPHPLRWVLGHVGYNHTLDPNSIHSKSGLGQPLLVGASRGTFAVAFSGRLGHIRLDTPPSEMDDVQRIAAGIANHPSSNWLEAIHGGASSCVAAYAIQVLTNDGLYYLRDARGYRPLVMNEIFATFPVTKDGLPSIKNWKCVMVVSEESAAIALRVQIEKRYPDVTLTIKQRTIGSGTIGHVRLDGSWTEWEIKQHRRDSQEGVFITHAARQRCALEAFHFMRGSGHFDELDLDYFREECGGELARADKNTGHNYCPSTTLVVGCPRGGIAAGRGYAARACLPYTQVLRATAGVTRKSVTVDHTESQGINRVIRKRKEHPTLVMNGDVSGKTVILVNDLVVQSATVKKAVQLLRKAGAVRVHVRIAAPAVQNNCVWGTVLPDVEDLFSGAAGAAGGAGAGNAVVSLAHRIGADTLEYLSPNRFEKLIGKGFCKGCLFRANDLRSPAASLEVCSVKTPVASI